MNVSNPIPATDEEGYLIDPADWSDQVALAFAQHEDISLTQDHWEAIRFMRDYYQEHQVIPDVRHVVKHLSGRFGAAARNMMFELFPYGYVKQACKIAGMKRPRGWSTG
ncbi:MAG: TusE/DsrC/DsvC family sulfur relay protein [Sulfuritalea sp.]|nr:TusE/DsrC/DsvC family sulfur relay protein [Sulfuritalea sp.]